MDEFKETLESLDSVSPEKALGVFVAAVRAAVPDAPACYFDLMAAEGIERRKLQRQCEAHFNSLSTELRKTIHENTIIKAQKVVQNPFERLASKMTESLDRTNLDDLFPK